jgi:hypothetical protein
VTNNLANSAATELRQTTNSAVLVHVDLDS